jgi:hypothetical protein
MMADAAGPPQRLRWGALGPHRNTQPGAARAVAHETRVEHLFHLFRRPEPAMRYSIAAIVSRAIRARA